MAGDTPIHITSENWKIEVMQSSIPVLVDFWAEWCGPCRAIAPLLEQVAKELAGKIKIAKVNVDEAQALAAEFGIRSIPTLLILKGGVVQKQMVGAMNKDALVDKLTPYL